MRSRFVLRCLPEGTLTLEQAERRCRDLDSVVTLEERLERQHLP